METQQKTHVSEFLGGAVSIGNLVGADGTTFIPKIARHLHHRWAVKNTQKNEHKDKIISLLREILTRDAGQFTARYMPAVSDLWTDKNIEQVRAALSSSTVQYEDEIVLTAQEILKYNR